METSVGTQQAVCAETTASQNEIIDQAVVGQCGGCE